MTEPGSPAAPALGTGRVLGLAFRVCRERPLPLFGLALAGALAGMAADVLLRGVPLLAWFVVLVTGIFFQALLIRVLDGGGKGRSAAPAREGPGFGLRVLSYVLAVLVLDVAGGVVALAGLVAGGLLALLVLALGSFLPGPLVTGLVVFVLLLGPALPLVVLSMGGVFVGFTSVLGGQGGLGAVAESFRIARRHWKLVGAVATITYGVLFVVGVGGSLVGFYYTLHHLTVHVVGPRAPRLAAGVRRLLGPRLWKSLPRGTHAPAWWTWGVAPLLVALPLPWVLAASHVIYVADREGTQASVADPVPSVLPLESLADPVGRPTR